MSPPIPLVIGVGNPARGDDGAGPAVAAAARADRRLARAVVRTAVQLTPELAAEVAEASVVVIVDARAGGTPGHVDCERVAVTRGDTRSPVSSHHLSPAALARLAALAYGRIPPVYLVTVAARSFETAAPLSPAVEAAVSRAAGVVAALSAPPG